MKVIILGAGPAGLSCAIHLLKAGNQVHIIDRRKRLSSSPGETLHPGIEPLLEQLDVMDKIRARGFLRHFGIENHIDGTSVYEPYHKEYTWKGFQIPRQSFNSILRHKAMKLGVNLSYFTGPLSINRSVNTGNIISISIGKREIVGDYYIDATGKNAWLVRQLEINILKYSSRLIAHYGYASTKDEQQFPHPKMFWDSFGWTWVAQIEKLTLSWVRLDIPKAKKREKDWLPEQLSGCQIITEKRAVDVSWRTAKIYSKKNYFFIGDAAWVLDPSSSHGVLKAVMSGIMVAHLLNQVKTISVSKIHRAYQKWMEQWFRQDMRQLSEQYQQRKLSFI